MKPGSKEKNTPGTFNENQASRVESISLQHSYQENKYGKIKKDKSSYFNSYKVTGLEDKSVAKSTTTSFSNNGKVKDKSVIALDNNYTGIHKGNNKKIREVFGSRAPKVYDRVSNRMKNKFQRKIK